MFKKAEPKQAKLKISIYGPAGSGKTFSTLLMAEALAKADGKRIAYIDTERGTDFYAQAVAARPVHPAAFDFDAVYTKSLSEALRSLKGIDTKVHGVVVIDSISHFWEAAIEAYSGRMTGDSIPMHAWGKIKKPYKELINILMGMPAHVFILGRQKNLFDTDSRTGQMIKAGVAMQAEGQTAYEPNICLRMTCQEGESEGRASYVAFVEKDRTGVLAGRSLVNPNFETIKPLLPLLGVEQAPMEDEEERIAADAELHSEQADKVRGKSAKSIELFDEIKSVVQACASIEELGMVGKDIKKHRRYLIVEHQEALRVLYTHRRDAIIDKQAPDEF